jgi:ABC-type glycerol-3-phosphate transport system substrate-binding protein
MTVNNVSQTKGERMKRARWLWLAAVLMLALIGAGCGGGNEESSGGTATSGGAKDKVTLQLKWVTQAQFAGYYAAKAQGYYDDEGLDVDIKVVGLTSSPSRSSSAARPSSASTGSTTCSPRAIRTATSSTSPRSSREAG